MMRHHVMRGLAWLLPLLSMGLHAQALRDPTLAPPEANAGAATGAAAAGADGAAVIVRDGKSYLVVGTRLYAPGQKMGSARVERITETEVWLRDATGLRKLPRFAGVQRRAVTPAPGCVPARAPGTVQTRPTAQAKPSTAPAKRRAQPPSSANASAASSNAPPATACDGAQP